MAKAYSKAAKRRQKRGRQGTGVKAMFRHFSAMQEMMAEAENVPTEDPREQVKAARARVMGREASPALLSPMLCEEAGRAISIGAKKDAEILWRAFLGYDKAEHAYFARIIGRPRFANVSRIDYIPKKLETRPDDTPDTRSADEKDRDAVNGWQRWQGYLGHMASHQKRAIIRAAWQMDELHKGDRLTVHGEAFVAAVRSLADLVEAG